MRILNLRKFRELLDNTILSVCGLLLISLVLLVSWQVFSRYVLNDPSSFTDELSRYFMVWLGFLGSCYLFGKKGHLSISLLNDKLTGIKKKGLEIIINISILSFVNTAMLKGGWMLVNKTLSQYSPAMQIPMAYVYFILPLSAVFITIYITLNCIDIFHKEDN